MLRVKKPNQNKNKLSWIFTVNLPQTTQLKQSFQQEVAAFSLATEWRE